MEKIKHRHGGPWDRGSADSYYERGFSPHYYEGATYQSRLIERHEMTPEEIAEYAQGYEYNEAMNHHKDWG